MVRIQLLHAKNTDRFEQSSVFPGSVLFVLGRELSIFDIETFTFSFKLTILQNQRENLS